MRRALSFHHSKMRSHIKRTDESDHSELLLMITLILNFEVWMMFKNSSREILRPSDFPPLIGLV